MYAGTTIRHGSGRIVGVHQKVDRAARYIIKKHLPKSVNFPDIKTILYFEGNNGPDGLKRKHPSSDGQPWHFIDPNNPSDRGIINNIDDHIHNLAAAIKKDDNIKAAYEAAWLAHCIVDGLTPAHHYPLGDKIQELWGKSHTERKSVRDKTIIIGENLRDTLSKNWEYWGAGGVFTTHGMFELGVASAIATTNFKKLSVTKRDINKLNKVGYEKLYLETLDKVNKLGMYDTLGVNGWTKKLADQTKNVLIPIMVKMVVLAWYDACVKSGGMKP
jgi:hypothetical protein